MLISDRQTTAPPYVIQMRVMWAIMLRDIRTRFFGHGLGYLVAVGWPLAHILVLLIIYAAMGRIVPMGDSLCLFFATGLVPFMSFIYVARFVMMSMLINKALLQLPVVKITDIVFARAALEFLGSCTMTCVLLTILYFIDVDIVPRNVMQAYEALGASLLLGLGFGIVNAMIAAAMPAWTIIFILVQIILYMTSGIVFMVDALPEIARQAISYNPIFHGVEWMRSAYYEGYVSHQLDKGYIISWAVGSLCLGLVIERLIRGRLLQN